jgi:hypothetical protein
LSIRSINAGVGGSKSLTAVHRIGAVSSPTTASRRTRTPQALSRLSSGLHGGSVTVLPTPSLLAFKTCSQFAIYRRMSRDTRAGACTAR